MKKVTSALGMSFVLALLAGPVIQSDATAGGSHHGHHGHHGQHGQHGQQCYSKCPRQPACGGYRYPWYRQPNVCYQPFPGHPVICKPVAPRRPWRRPHWGAFSFWTPGWGFGGCF
ncbi:MAG: hypothetical protein P9M00_00525 [Candidatus Tritonobacter lacicola]|nr:hypothetical protein [Candidatus Tritonobacter lacicola]